MLAALLVSLVLPATARAAERILDQLSTETGSVIVQFNCPMSFVSNYPLRTGDELRIELQPLPGCALGIGPLGETLPVPQGNPAGLVDVRLDQSLGQRRALTLHFARTVDFLIRPRPGLTAIEVVLARRVGHATVEAAPPPPAPSRAPTRSLPSQEDLDKLTADARAAMQDRDYDAAIRLYTRLLEYPEHPGRPQAQEYVGLAHERKGELAQAKLEYEEYLRRYPDGTDAEIVKQRLAAIVTLQGATKPQRGAIDASRWEVTGAIAQEYRHDENTLTSNGVTNNGVGQSALDSDFDVEVHRRGEAHDFKARVFAGYLSDMANFGGVSASQAQVPQAYVEVDGNVNHWVTRLGRQSQTTGGVYGTFDGAFVGWLVKPGLRLGIAAGSPLETYALNNPHDRVFANLSADFLGVAPGLDLTAFVYQDNYKGVQDARQVGMEARYYQNGHSLVGQLDYDISYNVLNSATLLASWALPARWTMTGIFDHRRNPFASTYNALIGQPTTSLNDLINSLGIGAVRALALDRSAMTDTATLGLQRPIGERLQWNGDVTYGHVGGTPASGGVPAVPSSGSALSFSTELLGGGWIVDGDMNTVGVSYTTRAGTRVGSAYTALRFPIGTSVRMGPRVQVSHTSGSDPNTGTSAGWSASPALLADWRFRHGVVQLELGYERASFDASLPPGVPIDPSNPQPTLLNQQTRRAWGSLGYIFNF